MGRRRKFYIDEVVGWTYSAMLDRPQNVGWAVVTDYRVKGAQSQYQVVRLDYATGPSWGRPIWVNAEKLRRLSESHPLNPLLRPNVRRVVAANERLGSSTDRGCRCQCCPHTAIPRSVVAQEARDNAEQ